MCSRLNRAKVFVDVDISQPLHAKVRIELPKGRSYWQPIIYENISAYCPRCRHRGHAEPVCKLSKDSVGSSIKEKNITLPSGMVIRDRASKRKEILEATSSSEGANKVEGVIEKDSASIAIASGNVDDWEEGEIRHISGIAVQHPALVAPSRSEGPRIGDEKAPGQQESKDQVVAMQDSNEKGGEKGKGEAVPSVVATSAIIELSSAC